MERCDYRPFNPTASICIKSGIYFFPSRKFCAQLVRPVKRVRPSAYSKWRSALLHTTRFQARTDDFDLAINDRCAPRQSNTPSIAIAPQMRVQRSGSFMTSDFCIFTGQWRLNAIAVSSAALRILDLITTPNNVCVMHHKLHTNTQTLPNNLVG